jgi:CRP/FNR family transcriptional regulator, cyclic AMP receptor protein
MDQVRSYLQTLMAVDDRPLHFHPGQMLFTEGEIGKEMYIIREGSVVLKHGNRTLEEVGIGGIIGEMALIDASPRSASAVAGSECSVTAVNEYTLLELVRKVPGLSLEIMRIMAGRLRRANKAPASSAKKAAKKSPAKKKPAAKAAKKTAKAKK